MFISPLFFVVLYSLLRSSLGDVFVTGSGLRIPLEDFRGKLPAATLGHISDSVFEHTAAGELVSKHNRIIIRDVAPIISNCSEDIESNLSDFGIVSSYHHIYCRRGRALTFVFEKNTGQLITAIGRQLQLLPLNSTAYPTIFYNAQSERLLSSATSTENRILSFAERNQTSFFTPATSVKKSTLLSNRDPNGTEGIQKCPPHALVSVDIDLGYDLSLCSLFSFNQQKVDTYINDIVRGAQTIFHRSLCISLEIAMRDRNCSILRSGNAQGTLNMKDEMKNCVIGNRECSRTSALLETLRQKWPSYRTSRSQQYDIVFYITGFGDDTPVAGAAYANSICSPEYGYAWMEGTLNVNDASAVFAHELGHVLGASHDPNGVMAATIQPNRNLGTFSFSLRSTEQIRTFIEEDSRSWCVTRKGGDVKDIWTKESWFAIPTGLDEPVRDIAISEANLDGKKDVFLLSTGGTLHILKDMKCIGDKCSFTNKKQESMYDQKEKGNCQLHSFALVNLASAVHWDVIVAELCTVQKAPVAQYRVSLGTNGRESRRTWSDPMEVPNWSPYSLRTNSKSWIGIDMVGIATGAISSPLGMDLVWMYLDQKNGRNFARYRIGFGISPTGKMSGGWSQDFDVPGWFGSVSNSIRVALYDVYGAGKIDIVLLLHDFSDLSKSTYYRVGRAVNAKGQVTGGWSNFVRIPLFPREEEEGWYLLGHVSSGVSVTSLGNGRPTLVMPRQLGREGATRGELILSRELFKNLSFETLGTMSEKRDAMTLCSRCYEPQDTDRCVDKVKFCTSWLDKVKMGDAKSETVDMLPSASVRLSRSEKGKRLITCDGFDHLYTLPNNNDDGCKLANAWHVVANGVEQAVRGALSEITTATLKFDYNFKEPQTSATSGSNVTSTAPKVSVESSAEISPEVMKEVFSNLRDKRDDGMDILVDDPKTVQSDNKSFNYDFYLPSWLNFLKEYANEY